jgi:hypothetical protein
MESLEDKLKDVRLAGARSVWSVCWRTKRVSVYIRGYGLRLLAVSCMHRSMNCVTNQKIHYVREPCLWPSVDSFGLFGLQAHMFKNEKCRQIVDSGK